jgi:hypothetical protein
MTRACVRSAMSPVPLVVVNFEWPHILWLQSTEGLLKEFAEVAIAGARATAACAVRIYPFLYMRLACN